MEDTFIPAKDKDLIAKKQADFSSFAKNNKVKKTKSKDWYT